MLATVQSQSRVPTAYTEQSLSSTWNRSMSRICSWNRRLKSCLHVLSSHVCSLWAYSDVHRKWEVFFTIPGTQNLEDAIPLEHGYFELVVMVVHLLVYNASVEEFKLFLENIRIPSDNFRSPSNITNFYMKWLLNMAMFNSYVRSPDGKAPWFP